MGQHPGQGQLRGRHALGPGQLLKFVYQAPVVGEVFGLVARHAAAEVGGVQVVEAFDVAREKAPAQRRVAHKADAQLAGGVQHAVGFHAPVKQRVLGLDGRDGVHRVRPADGLGRHFAQAQIAHLARPHQLGHGPHRLLNGHVRVGAVHVVQVDVVGTQALQGAVDGHADVLGPAVDGESGAELPRAVNLIAELGGDEVLRALAGNGLAHQPLVQQGTVEVGGVEQVHAQFPGPVNGGDALGLVGRAVNGHAGQGGHAHAAQSLNGNFESLAAQGYFLDGVHLLVGKGMEGGRLLGKGPAALGARNYTNRGFCYTKCRPVLQARPCTRPQPAPA